MEFPNLRSISDRFRNAREPASQRLQIGDLVTFHETNVYAKVVPREEYIASFGTKGISYLPKPELIDEGEIVCLMTASGQYLTMPTTVLEKITKPHREIKRLRQFADLLQYIPKSPHTEMLFYSLNMKISFLEKAVNS